jgi:hypothetical protein
MGGMRLRSLIITFFLTILPTCLVAGDFQRSDIKVLTRMIFSSGNSGSGIDRMQKPCLQKFHGPVSVSIVGVVSTIQKQLISKALEDVADHANISYAIYDQTTPPQALAHLRIVVAGKSAITDRNYKTHCEASRSTDLQCKITHASVIVPMNLDSQQFNYCIYHELMHGFGFQGHVWHQPSILNPRLEQAELSA